MTCYLADVRSQLQLRSLATGSLKQSISLPGIGSINSFSGRREDFEFFFSFSSFANPGAIYRSAACAAEGCCLCDRCFCEEVQRLTLAGCGAATCCPCL